MTVSTSVIDVMAGGLGRHDAESLIAAVSDAWTPRVEAKLYYPYHWYHFRYRARTVFGRSALRLSCVVDSRTRVGATTDDFDTERLHVGADEVLDAKLDDDAALVIAKRYAGYVMRNRRKAFVAPETEVLERARVHKPFWIVGCEKHGEAGFRVLVDAMTGEFRVLSTDPSQTR